MENRIFCAVIDIKFYLRKIKIGKNKNMFIPK